MPSSHAFFKSILIGVSVIILTGIVFAVHKTADELATTQPELLITTAAREKSEQTNQILPTTDWRIYSNPDDGYQIAYHPDWTLYEGSHHALLSPPAYGYGYQIAIKVLELDSAPDFSHLEDGAYPVVEFVNSKGISGIRLPYLAYFVNERRLYIINIDGLGFSPDKPRSVFETVLDSFEFVEH